MSKDIHKKKHLSSFQLIILGFASVILLGAIILMLPVSSAEGVITPFNQTLFTSTSAVCVTGLAVLDTGSYWSVFGQVVILLLIQIGGLGVVTVAVSVFMLSGRKISLMQRSTMQNAISAHKVGGIVRLTKFILKGTLFIEMAGALALLPVFYHDFGRKGIWMAVFHSISAFCNAGFDILGNNSMVPYVGNVWINLVICGLIIAGGLGFVVWIDLRLSLIHYREHFKYFKIKRYLESLSLHTKIALISTFVLIFGGMTVIFILEFQNPLTLKSLPFSQKILASFFQSVTLRTAGFATVDMASLHQATKFFMSIIMFIGGSPAGTAGGVKTVTFVIGLLYVRALMRGDENIHVFKRTIDDQIVKRALTIMLISFAIALTGLFILSISEQADFIDLLFEVFSAFATVGLTAGITPTLTFVGKIVIIILMYIGRIGPITMVLIFVRKYNAKKGKDVNYIKEHILIG